jgi:hypothetical protein
MNTRTAIFALGTLAGLAAFAAPAMAVSNPVPDVYSDFTTITYTVSGNTGHLTATGFAENLRTNPNDATHGANITNGAFTLHANLTLSGSSIVGVSGDATITGNSQTYFNSTSLLSVVNTPSTDVFTFNFSNGTGTYPGAFQVILHGGGNTGFSSFASNFASAGGNGIAFSDTVAVPEPASLGALGLGGLLLLRRRKAHA